MAHKGLAEKDVKVVLTFVKNNLHQLIGLELEPKKGDNESRIWCWYFAAGIRDYFTPQHTISTVLDPEGRIIIRIYNGLICKTCFWRFDINKAELRQFEQLFYCSEVEKNEMHIHDTRHFDFNPFNYVCRYMNPPRDIKY